jgi:DNA invertase Pin-like site-specific DNA recombinase
VSSKRQQDEGGGLETQERLCREAAERRGYKVTHVVRDTHTGVEWERPGVLQLLQYARAGHIDVVLADRVDRIGRGTPYRILKLMFQQTGARFEFASQQFDAGPSGELLEGMTVEISDYERKLTLERTRDGRNTRVVEKQQRLPGRRPPLGYRFAGEKNATLTPAPDTRGIVERIFRERSEGYSINAIARRLTADGVPTATGAERWIHATLTGIIRNPVYKGQMLAFRYRSVQTARPKSTRKRKHSKLGVNPEGMVELPAVEPLVSVELWERAQTGYVRPPDIIDPEAVLLRGRVYCATCHRPMNVYRFAQRNGKRGYRCRNQYESDFCSTPHTIEAQAIEAVAWERARQVIETPGIIRAALERQRDEDPLAGLVRGLRDKVADRERRRRLVRASLEDIEDAEDRAIELERLNRLTREQRELEAELEQWLARGDSWDVVKERLLRLEEWCKIVRERLDTFTPSERAKVYRHLGLRAVVEPGPRLRRGQHQQLPAAARVRIYTDLPELGDDVHVAASFGGRTKEFARLRAAGKRFRRRVWWAHRRRRYEGGWSCRRSTPVRAAHRKTCTITARRARSSTIWIVTARRAESVCAEMSPKPTVARIVTVK